MSRPDPVTGDGWAFVTGLQDAHPGTTPLAGDRQHHHSDRPVPSVQSLGKLDGVTVVRLAFRAGDTMAAHTAAWPILILGQVGTVQVTVDDDPEPSVVTVTPGTALNIEAGRVHSLTTAEPATVTLAVLHGSAVKDDRPGGRIMT